MSHLNRITTNHSSPHFTELRIASTEMTAHHKPASISQDPHCDRPT